MYSKTIRRLRSICYLMSFAIVSKNKKPKPYNFFKSTNDGIMEMMKKKV